MLRVNEKIMIGKSRESERDEIISSTSQQLFKEMINDTGCSGRTIPRMNYDEHTNMIVTLFRVTT